jgi:hypothetical protein
MILLSSYKPNRRLYNEDMFEIEIIKDKITLEELKALAHKGFGHVIKAVVDIEKGIMAVGGELHVDMQILLIEQENSANENTWGINFYIDQTGEDFLEFDSMINLKPALGNKSRDVENPETRKMIKAIVNRLVK